MTGGLPNLPLIQERFFHILQNEFLLNQISYPEFEVIDVFLQTWDSTSLGFNEIGGAAITSAYTTIITNLDLEYVAVFFGERMAYTIQHPNNKFWEDVQKHNMCSAINAYTYEKILN